ncbi:hypothetical protein ACFE04_000627 [Oxalis oulophora]
MMMEMETTKDNKNHNNNNSGVDKKQLNLNGIVYDLKPVLPGDSGEGLPYAPENWPNPGDNWQWKTGKRASADGFYSDRYLFTPDSFPEGGIRQNKYFLSIRSLRNYMNEHFPNADIDAFFASFSWKIPAVKNEEVKNTTREKRKSRILSTVQKKGEPEHKKSSSSSDRLEEKSCQNSKQLNLNGIVFNLKPMPPGEAGEGLPYAPADWPNHGDNWKWRTGNRISLDGYYFDRYLFAPDSFFKGGKRGNLCFQSISAVKRYININLPDADVDAFLASFSWMIPAMQNDLTSHEEENSTRKKRKNEIETPSSAQNREKQKAGAGSSMIREQKTATSSSARLQKQSCLNSKQLTDTSATEAEDTLAIDKEKTDKDKKGKDGALGDREHKLNDQVMCLQQDIDDNSSILQHIDDQIASLQQQRDKLVNIIDSKEKKKNALITAAKNKN